MFQMSTKGPTFNFLIFSNRMEAEKAQWVRFYNFRHCEIFQNEFFVVKFSFLSATARYIRILFLGRV